MTKNSFERNEEKNWQTVNKFESLNIIVSIKVLLCKEQIPPVRKEMERRTARRVVVSILEIRLVMEFAKLKKC